MNSMRRNSAGAIAGQICALPSSALSPHYELGTSGGEVNEMDRCYQRALVRNRVNFTKSKIPNRVMFYDASEWIDYSISICKDLREGFVNGRASVHLKTHSRSLIVDFLRMMEIDLNMGSLRWIAWIDVEGRCFFPEMFSKDNCRDCLPYLRDKSKRISNFCREDGVDTAQSVPRASIEPETVVDREAASETQAHWVSTVVPLTKGLLLRLEDDDRACKIVKNVFLRGMMKSSSSETVVTAVYRCPSGGVLFQEFKRVSERTKAARGHTNIRYGWYGGDSKEVADIVLHGFGPSNVSSGSEAFGIGINLSPASHSFLSASSVQPDVNGERHVVLCLVVMGNMEEVQIGSGQAQPSCEEFDSGVDDVRNSKRFVVWSSNMSSILPEYILTFKCSTQIQAEGSTKCMERTMPHECPAPLSFAGETVSKSCARVDTPTGPHTRMSFPSLFAALEKSLPSDETKMLSLLYKGYKTGKVNKDVLIRKVRLIVGDALLISAIRSIDRKASEQTNKRIKSTRM